MQFARLAALFVAVLTAFGFQPPPRDSLGTVTGRVVEAHSGDAPKGIRKALIILKHGQEPGIGAYSDEKGNYRLRTEPGAYSVTVERDGYVASPQSQIKTITLEAGMTTDGVDLELIRTGAISGRIMDPDGEPVPNASVQLRSARERGRGQYLGAATDDRGAYRIFQVPPGKYHLSAAYQPAFEQREVKLQIAGGTAEETYSTTYFPATSDVSQATAINIPAGADLDGFDVQLQRVHAVHIRGRVSGVVAAAIPVVMIVLQPVGSEQATAHDGLVRDPEGQFDLSGVLPGKYTLLATAPDLTNRGTGPTAQQIVEVGQTDVDGIQLTLAAPQTVKGFVMVPEGRKIPQGLLVVLSNRARTNTQAGGLGQVGPDGAFTLSAVQAGDYDLELGSAGPGDDLYVSAIHRGDDDVLAHGLHVGGPGAELVEIVLKPNGGTVDIVAHTSKGDPFPEANVALLPDPPRREQMALYGTCMTDASGKCTLRGVAPGEYHAFAVSKDAGIDFRDPNSTKDLEKQSKAVKVAASDQQTVEIAVAAEDQ